MHQIKNILLHLSAEHAENNSGPAAYAIGIAEMLGAHVEALLFDVTTYLPEDAYGRKILSEVKQRIVERNALGQRKAAMLEATAKTKGVLLSLCNKKLFPDESREYALQHARINDLTVAGIDNSGLVNEKTIAKQLLFKSGRPIVIVPQTFEMPARLDNIVIAWDYSRAAARALGDAMPLLKYAKTINLLVITGEKPLVRYVDEDDLLEKIARHDIKAAVKKSGLSGRTIGDAILEEAAILKADLIVMGGYGHPSLIESILGGATAGVLKNAQIPVLMAH